MTPADLQILRYHMDEISTTFDLRSANVLPLPSSQSRHWSEGHPLIRQRDGSVGGSEGLSGSSSVAGSASQSR